MTTLFDPLVPMFELSRDLERLFARNGGTVRSFIPAADVIVTDDDVTVHMDVPGFDVDEIDINLVGDTLTVSGERTYPYTADGAGNSVWQRLERGFGKFERVLRVPDGLDPDAVTADLVNGVLTLHIAKPEARKPRKIQIGSGAGQPAAIEEKSEERELAGAAA